MDNDKATQITLAKYYRDCAIRDAQAAINAAMKTYDDNVQAILAGNSVLVSTQPAPAVPEGIITVHPEDLNNDEVFRNIIRGLKTYNTTYFRSQWIRLTEPLDANTMDAALALRNEERDAQDDTQLMATIS